MLEDAAGIRRVILACGTVDLRKGIDGLATIIGDKYGQKAGSSILAGDDTYDMIVPHGRYVNTYVSEGMVADWNSKMPYVDLEKPWWNQDARAAYTFYSKIYAAIGDISHLNTGASTCMLFNKAMFEEYKLEYPYQLVLDGKWTFDKFAEYSRLAAKDLNGDTVIDAENDQVGYSTSWWGGPIQVLYSGNQRVCGKDEDGAMMLTLNTEQTVDIFDRFFAFTADSCAYIYTEKDPIPAQVFKEGRSMFVDIQIRSTMGMRDMTDDFGIVPWPKMDESIDKYYANVDAGSSLILIPITATDHEMMSIVIEQLAYLGWRDVVPTYYDVVLQTKYTRDEESAAMIDIIRDGRVCDIGYFYGIGALNSTGYNLVKNPSMNFASFYAKNEKTCQANIDKINEQYRTLEN